MKFGEKQDISSRCPWAPERSFSGEIITEYHQDGFFMALVWFL